MSGPAVLKLSAWAARYLNGVDYDFTISVNWMPVYTEQSLILKFRNLRDQLAAQRFVNRNPFQLPQRLWEYFIHEAGIKADIRWADLPAREQNKLIKILAHSNSRLRAKQLLKKNSLLPGVSNLTRSMQIVLKAAFCLTFILREKYWILMV